PEEPPGGPALQGDADRRLQRDALLLQVQPGGPRRPPVHRQRPEAALLQVVQERPRQPGPAQAGPRQGGGPPLIGPAIRWGSNPGRGGFRRPVRGYEAKYARPPGRRIPAEVLKEFGYGSSAGPLQERDRQGDGDQVPPR